MKKPIVCIDRDGTLIHDTREHLFLGRDEDWKEQVRILPKAVEGLQLLNTIPDAAIYMVTNQAGVAISDYPNLTEEKAHEVCRYVMAEFEKKGASLHGYFLCPHATPAYTSRKPDVNFHPELVHDSQCLKPAPGMIMQALEATGVPPADADVFVIGDRESDVRAALNAGGTGILIPFVHEPGEEEKVHRMIQKDKIFVAEDMVRAAEIILSYFQEK